MSERVQGNDRFIPNHLSVNYSYNRVKLVYEEFLINVTSITSEADAKELSYYNETKALGKNGKNNIKIHLSDMLSYFNYENDSFVEGVSENSDEAISLLFYNTPRGLRLLYDTVEKIRLDFANEIIENQEYDQYSTDSYFLAVKQLRNKLEKFPKQCIVDYEIHLVAPNSYPYIPLHEIKADYMGSIIKIKGIVAKVTHTRPQITVAAYTCENCGSIEFEHVQHSYFTPKTNCSSVSCISTKKKGTLVISMRESIFCKRQLITIQEASENVPLGSVPKQIQAIATGQLTQQLVPGSKIAVCGIYIPEFSNGHQFGNRLNVVKGVVKLTAILANNDAKQEQVELDNNYENFINTFREECSDKLLYERLAESLVPSIYGLSDIKKLLLLQLVGGYTNIAHDGLKIRGEIHIALIGDPGIAKSQLLRRISQLSTRSHYTCGKGASGVGLTASVVKDQTTGELYLEGGAIVLSDNGICCIDEFDKMADNDKTAIHEVMEQQTISISKAGLVATLNARTKILAAANPMFGRYDISKSAMTNINLPAALLSRFDIVYVALDEIGNREKDYVMATHLLNIHKNKEVGRVKVSEASFKTLTNNEILMLIEYAKQFKPMLDPIMAEKIVNYYVELRQDEQQRGYDLGEITYVTPRALLAILRLMQAIARLRFDNSIKEEDYFEAIRLFKSSKESIIRRKYLLNNEENISKMQILHEIFKNLIHNCKNPEGWIEFDELLNSTDGVLDDVESMLDTLAASGQILWKSIQHDKFKYI